jgi:phosphoribosyl 1,2-cyclic phosphate phosphodiesterase
MKITLLGTGDSGQMPVYGCDCKSCSAARTTPARRRTPCSALLEVGNERWLIDSGQMDLAERFPVGTLTGILQTHYHADHAQGLLHLRWGVDTEIPVYGPEDEKGFADLYAHPGILTFQPPFQAAQQYQLSPVLNLRTIPLQHSKPTLGYVFGTQKIAYLTDTVGLPQAAFSLLQGVELMIIECTFPPMASPHRNHNDVNVILALHERLQPKRMVLTHIGHAMDVWAHENTLPEGVTVGRDGEVFDV